MKTLTLIYCGEDGHTAKVRAAELRREDNAVLLCSAFDFDGAEACDRVVVMPDVPDWREAKLVAAYGNKIIARPRVVEPAPSGETIVVAPVEGTVSVSVDDPAAPDGPAAPATQDASQAFFAEQPMARRRGGGR